MRILYVTTGISTPPAHGSQIRRWNVLQGLLAAGSTDALILCRHGQAEELQAFDGCEHCFPIDLRLIESSLQTERFRSTIGRGLLTLTSALPFEFQYPHLAKLSDEVAKVVDFRNYDLVWFNTAHTAMAFREMPCGVTILDGDDFEYVRESSLLWSSPWYGAKVFNYVNVAKLWWWERSFSKAHAVVVRCSDVDRARQPAPNVIVIPNGANIPEHCSRAAERRLLFVGLMSYPPNSQAIEWFLTRIWPRIRREVPDAACDIVGKQPPLSIADEHGCNGVEVHGFVNDLAPFYQKAATTIVPLRAGSGTRLKILESLAHAVPVVSTTLGACGIEAQASEGLMRCDSEAEFAAQCISHLRNPLAYQEHAFAGREFVREHYDWRAIQMQVAELVRGAAVANAATQVVLAR